MNHNNMRGSWKGKKPWYRFRITMSMLSLWLGLMFLSDQEERGIAAGELNDVTKRLIAHAKEKLRREREQERVYEQLDHEYKRVFKTEGERGNGPKR